MSKNHEFIKIGHRGAMGYEPENTLRSVKKALELNVDMVEVDVFRCSTGEVMVFHDHKLKRTTDGKGYVTKKTFEELRKLDAGKGEKIPTLTEVLDLLDGKARINIEIKGKRVLHAVMRIINHYVKQGKWLYTDFLLSSFSRKTLKKISRLNGQIPIAPIISYRLVGLFKFAQKIHAYSVHASKSLVNRELVEAAHKHGLKVFVWTVNEPDDIKRLKALGVDGMFSDYPDRL